MAYSELYSVFLSLLCSVNSHYVLNGTLLSFIS